jgi:hypothetical protein
MKNFILLTKTAIVGYILVGVCALKYMQNEKRRTKMR